MQYSMSFKDALTGRQVMQNVKTQDLGAVKNMLKAYSGLSWFKRRSHIRELNEIGATGNVPKRPRQGQCNFFIVQLH